MENNFEQDTLLKRIDVHPTVYWCQISKAITSNGELMLTIYIIPVFANKSMSIVNGSIESFGHPYRV